MKGHCQKCEKEAEILQGHVGKRHQACGRKKGGGSPRINCGNWMLGSAPKKDEEKSMEKPNA